MRRWWHGKASRRCPGRRGLGRLGARARRWTRRTWAVASRRRCGFCWVLSLGSVAGSVAGFCLGSVAGVAGFCRQRAHRAHLTVFATEEYVVNLAFLFNLHTSRWRVRWRQNPATEPGHEPGDSGLWAVSSFWGVKIAQSPPAPQMCMLPVGSKTPGRVTVALMTLGGHAPHDDLFVMTRSWRTVRE